MLRAQTLSVARLLEDFQKAQEGEHEEIAQARQRIVQLGVEKAQLAQVEQQAQRALEEERMWVLRRDDMNQNIADLRAEVDRLQLQQKQEQVAVEEVRRRLELLSHVRQQAEDLASRWITPYPNSLPMSIPLSIMEGKLRLLMAVMVDVVEYSRTQEQVQVDTTQRHAAYTSVKWPDLPGL